jgi:5-oxoprolinase (ATP-hydrolysing)
MVRVNRFLEDTIVTCEGERHDSDPPWGIFGGHDGLNGALIRNEGQPAEEHWASKVTGKTLDAGDTLTIVVPSSGGYGDPLERDPEQVRSDVLDGFTTIELAERDYGVVIDPGTVAIDAAATRTLRDELGSRAAGRR